MKARRKYTGQKKGFSTLLFIGMVLWGDCRGIHTLAGSMLRVKSAILLFLLVNACHSAPATDILSSQDAYIWQHRWTTALSEAVHKSSSRIRAWRILGMEDRGDGQLSILSPDLETIARTGKPVFHVTRINRNIPEPGSQELIREMMAMVGNWRAAGVKVEGLEIDYDCPTRKLSSYAAFLAILKNKCRAEDLLLSITALPAWIPNPALPELLGKPDGVVLQVHFVSGPENNLIEPETAGSWVKSFSKLSPVPFRVALPLYGYRVTWDANGKVAAVEGEAPVGLSGPLTREIFSDPEVIAQLISGWRSDPIPNLIGIAWFRLPTTNDRRTWSLDTWYEIMDGQEITPRLTARAVPGEVSGVFDIYLSNQGKNDCLLPKEIQILTGEEFVVADALTNYRLVREPDVIKFTRRNLSLIRAGQRQTIGWLRSSSNEVNIHVYP